MLASSLECKVTREYDNGLDGATIKRAKSGRCVAHALGELALQHVLESDNPSGEARPCKVNRGLTWRCELGVQAGQAIECCVFREVAQRGACVHRAREGTLREREDCVPT